MITNDIEPYEVSFEVRKLILGSGHIEVIRERCLAFDDIPEFISIGNYGEKPLELDRQECTELLKFLKRELSEEYK